MLVEEQVRKKTYSVVDLDALAASLKSGHIAGAAVDVYPTEPFANGPGFETGSSCS